MGHLAVHSIHRFAFSVPRLEDARRFYTAFGMDVREAGDHLELRTFGSAHAWARIFEGGTSKKLQYVCYGIHERDLALFSQRIGAAGIAAPRHPMAKDDGLWLRDPDGTPLQLVVADKVSPDAPTQPTVPGRPAPGQGQAPHRSAVTQVRPRRLSHILQFTPDVLRMMAFCTEILGLRLSDRSQDLIAFMHTPHGSDHHLVAFAKSHAPGLHHSSWDVGSVDEVGHGMEQMRASGFERGWGVGRHVLGSNYFNYVRDPWGSYCEYSSGIDYIPQGLDWPAADHAPEDSLYVWGPSVPADFITNYEQAAS